MELVQDDHEIQIIPVAIRLITFGARMNISFIIDLQISHTHEVVKHASLIMLTTRLRMVSIF